MPLKPALIRPLAICVFRHSSRIMVAEGVDPLKGETFYRPLGGAIEFGERGTQTLAREIREELGAEVTGLRYLGTLENIFTYNGEAGHEIVLVYDGAFVDRSIYDRPALEGRELDGAPFKVVWMPLREFVPGGPPLYPDGLFELLTQLGGSRW